MNGTCPKCQDFIDETERLFGKTLHKYSFIFAECYSEREGRECRVMYHGTMGRLLFMLQDGAAVCLLGSSQTPFPPFVLLHGDGEYSWYYIITLAEVEAGNTLVSTHLWKKFISGQVYGYEWEATLLAERIVQLFALLDTTDDETLKRRVQRFLEKQPEI